MKENSLFPPLMMILFVLAYAFWPVDGCLRYFPTEGAWGFGARAYPGVSMTWYGRMGVSILAMLLAFPIAVSLGAWEAKLAPWLHRLSILVFTLSFGYLVVHETSYWIL